MTFIDARPTSSGRSSTSIQTCLDKLASLLPPGNQLTLPTYPFCQIAFGGILCLPEFSSSRLLSASPSTAVGVGPSTADWLATFVMNLSKRDEDRASRMHHQLTEHQERERAWRA